MYHQPSPKASHLMKNKHPVKQEWIQNCGDKGKVVPVLN
jgi:hypothetical protein